MVGLDFSEQMLELAKRKSAEAELPVSFVHGNALDLPFKDDYFDAATVGFGVRNVVDLDGGIAEMARVVRPGGRVVILEITTPHKPPLSWFYSRLVRPDRAAARRRRRRPRRLHVPAGVGAPLPARRASWPR